LGPEWYRKTYVTDFHPLARFQNYNLAIHGLLGTQIFTEFPANITEFPVPLPVPER
jgi:hypothetical protein